MKRIDYMGGAAVLAGLLMLSCGPVTPQFAIHQPLLKAKLENGLRLVVIPDETTPLVQVDVRYEVGSNEDPEGKAGLAHLVEHMMFQHRFGTDDIPIENRPPTFELIPQITTAFNAYTIWDKTHYWLQAPREDLQSLLQLEAARMNAGCNLIPKEQFEREREVVRNEIRQRLGTPEGQMIYETIRASYPEGHPYHEMTGGDDAQLSNITWDDVCTFMKNYYVPSRATVIVTGRVSHEEVGNMVGQYFSGIAPGTPAPRKEVTPITLKHQRITKEFDLERTMVNVVWAMPPQYTEEYDNAALMQFVLGFQAGQLAEEYGVCDLAVVTELGGSLAPVMLVAFELRKGKSPDECLEFVWKSARSTDRFFETGSANQKSMSVARQKQYFVSGMEPMSARAEFVANGVQFDKRVQFDGEDNYFYAHLDRLEKINPGKFKSFVQKTLKKEKALVFIAKATKEGKSGDERSKLKFSAKTHEQKADPIIDPATANTPLVVPKSDSILVNAERYALKNGMKVVLMPYEGLPIVHANLLFNVGGTHEPVEMAGLAGLAASISEPIDAQKTRAAGVSLDGDAGMDHTKFTARGINIYLSEVIVGLERLIKAGTMYQEGIKDYRKKFTDRFNRPSYQRDYVYQQELAKAVYGEEHPYTTKGDPTPKTMSKIGKDAALGFGRKHYSAKNATLIVAGNFDPAKAKKIIADNFGEWSGGHEDLSVSTEVPMRTNPEYIGVVDREGAPQMRLAIAFPAPAGIDEDQATRMVLSEMMTLRMASVRTELGSTYGVYAGRRMAIGPTYYAVGGNIDAKRAGESLTFIRAKLDELRNGVDFNRDFVVARKKVLKNLLAESTESFALAGRLARMAQYNLPPDYNETLARSVATMTPKKVKDLMAVELNPAKEIIVALADKTVLETAFKEAGLQVRLVDPAKE